MHENSILLVEDNEDDEMLTLDGLRTGGVCVGADIVVAHDGLEALDYMFTAGREVGEHSLPRVVLLDLKMPKIGGLEVVRRLRADERTRYTPIVVLTSSSQPEDIRKSYGNGANAYVLKSVNFEKFVQALRSIGSFWISTNETLPL